mmetsp:Transcript_44413/g.65095  ORF Transcript_44413/g.65095 Transcript_44413/m.65095 type:complete len:95 (-) Transcript_44413:252-536(-)
MSPLAPEHSTLTVRCTVLTSPTNIYVSQDDGHERLSLISRAPSLPPGTQALNQCIELRLASLGVQTQAHKYNNLPGSGERIFLTSLTLHVYTHT